MIAYNGTLRIGFLTEHGRYVNGPVDETGTSGAPSWFIYSTVNEALFEFPSGTVTITQYQHWKKHKAFEFFNSLVSKEVLKEFTSMFYLPEFDLTKSFMALQDLDDYKTLRTKHRDSNVVQSSSAIINLAQFEIKRLAIIDLLVKYEIDASLDRATRVLIIGLSFQKSVSIVLTELSRIYLAAGLTERQFDEEQSAKEGLWNLRLMYYGTIVMAGVLPGKKWWTPQVLDNSNKKAQQTVGYAVQGAITGSMIGGPVGAVIGGGIGIIVGIAFDF